ncbi:MAG: hypothetical protein EOO11_20570, partial [Chitinophagaceae bacterium]
MKMTSFFLVLALAAGCKKGGSNNNNNGGGGTPAQPQASIEDLTLNEGNSGSTAFNFRVLLSAAATAPVTVYYSTASGSGLAPEDYSAVINGSVTFAAGEREKSVPVSVVADDVREGDDLFTV